MVFVERSLVGGSKNHDRVILVQLLLSLRRVVAPWIRRLRQLSLLGGFEY